MRLITKRGQRQRPLHFEVLEDRLALSAAVGSLEVALPNLTAAKKPSGSTVPVGLTPAVVRDAYGFSNVTFGSIAADGAGQTIAIVDAFSDPNIVGDLAHFDQTFGLAAPPQFTVVNQSGGAKLPKANKGWAQEIALDVEWAHAIAPAANILLVEANNASSFGSAIDFARHVPGVSVISMSAAGNEYKSEWQADPLFTTPYGHAGVTFVMASGDEGAKPEYPSTSPNVLSVGGSTLDIGWNGTTYTRAGESVWSGSGGGISLFEGVPSYQNGLGLVARGTPDVTYDGNPNTGFAVYDSYGIGGWAQFGGTSAGAPQWAALLAVADQGRALNGMGPLANAQAALYSVPRSDFFDVTWGSNGRGSFATVGYDTASGLGSPIADRLLPDLASYSGSTYFTVAAIPTPSKPGKASGKSPKAHVLEGGDSLGGGAVSAESQVSAWATYDRRFVSSKNAAVGAFVSLSPRIADEAFSATELRSGGRRLGRGVAKAFASADDSSIAGIDGYFASASCGKLAATLG